MKYANIDLQSKLIGWSLAKSVDSVTVSDEEWQSALKSHANFYDGNSFVLKDSRTDEEISISDAKNLERKYTFALDSHLNSKAKERGYDSIHTAALRAAIPLSPFNAEGVAYATWMDECYQFGYKILADVKGGEITLPTVEEFIASLPILELPL